MAINREIIYGILEETQLAIDTAENGRIGVEMYLKNPQKYQLVLMDMQMPELDGLAATREIRASNAPGCKNVPIVAMTANAFKEDVENCLAAGMNGHIAKPVDVDVLIKTLKQYLG